MTLPFFGGIAASYGFMPGTPIDNNPDPPPTSRPTTLPTLASPGAVYYGWWDASSAAGVVQSGGFVTSVPNKITAGTPAAAGTSLDLASQPVLQTNVLGSLTGLDFTGSRKKALHFNQVDNPGANSAWTMFVVFTRNGMPALAGDSTNSKAGLMASFGAIQIASRLTDGDIVRGVYDPDNSAVVHDVNDTGSPTSLAGWVGQRWIGSAVSLGGQNVGGQGLNSVRSWFSKAPGVPSTFSRAAGPYETGAQIVEIGGTGNDLTFGQPAREIIHEVLLVKGLLNETDITALKLWADGRLFQPPVSPGAGEPAPPAGWQEVFYDDFPGTVLNSQKWPIKYGGAGASFNNMWDWDDTGIIVNDGLTMRMRKVSGRWKAPGIQLGSLATGFAGYGDYQVSVKFKAPAAKGIGPTIAMWPVSNDWPPEFDLAETPATDKQHVLVTWHWRGLSGENVYESISYAVDLTRVGGTVLTVRKQNGVFKFYIDGTEQTVPASWAAHPEPDNMAVALGSFVAAATDAWYANGPDGTTPDPYDVKYWYVRVIAPPSGGGGGSSGDFTTAQQFVADTNVGINIERDGAWTMVTAAFATYLAGLGIKSARLVYPWRPMVIDFAQGQPGTGGRLSDRPTQAQFMRIVNAAKTLNAGGIKVLLECMDTLDLPDMNDPATVTHIDGHIQNCATWLAGAGLDNTKIAIGPCDSYQGAGNAFWNAHRTRWLGLLRNLLPGFVLICGGGFGKSKDNMVVGTAEEGLYQISADPLVIYDFHYFSSLDNAGYTFLASQMAAWSQAKGGRPVIASAWGVDPTQATNYASFIPQMQASLVPMAFQHPIMWVTTANIGGWKLNMDGLDPRFNDGTNARPNFQTEIINEVAAVVAKLTGAPPPVVTPPPGSTLTDVQFAQNFVAPLTMGLNIERARIWYMTYQGANFANSDAYWDYLKSIGVTHVIGFYPQRPSIDMNGDGHINGNMPTNADIDRYLAPNKRATTRGIKVFIGAIDVINDSELNSYWTQIADYLDRFAQRIIANGLTPDMCAVRIYNELEDGTPLPNTTYNHFRMQGHAILRNRLPQHCIVHGSGYWNDSWVLLNSTDDPWQRPPDDRVIAEWHKYDGDNFDSQLDAFAAEAQLFRNRNGGIPIVGGEAGPDDQYIAGHQTYSSRWNYFILRYAQKVPSHRPMPWTVTDGSAFRMNKSPTDPTLITSLEDTMRQGDGVIRSSPGWGTINPGGGTTTPPVTPPPVTPTLDWSGSGAGGQFQTIGTVHAPTVGAHAPVTLTIAAVGIPNLQWVLVGSNFSWKTSPFTFPVTANPMTYTGAYITATGDFIKIMNPNDVNQKLDTAAGTVVVP